MTENEKEIAIQAKAEPHFTKQALLTEISAAIQDCFVAEIAQEKDVLHLQFFNGQRFDLALTEQ